MPNEQPIPAQLLSRYKLVYPHAIAHYETFLRGKRAGAKGLSWPDWCFCPLAGAHSVVQERADAEGLSLIQAGADIANVGALFAWQQTQGVYRFDQTIRESLWNTELEKLPTDVLYRLPEWCVWIETDPAADVMQSPGFFTFLEYDANAGRHELRMQIALQNPDAPGGISLMGVILHLTQPTLTGCLIAAWRESARVAKSHGIDTGVTEAEMIEASETSFYKLVAPRLSLLLYLCSKEPDLRDARGTTKFPANPQPVKVKGGEKVFPASGPTAWNVGARVGAAIREAQEDHWVKSGQPAQGGTHARPRPHVRKAHWHAFRTGPRNQPDAQNLVLHWLPPIPVNAPSADELAPVIHPVKP